jgi:hypothetical protein
LQTDQFEWNKNYILNNTNIRMSFSNEMSLNLTAMYADIQQGQNVILQLGPAV